MQNEIKKELDRLLFTSHEQIHASELAGDEVTAVKRNLQTNNIEAYPDEVRCFMCCDALDWKTN